jgi:hypothetical protein
MIRQEQYEIWVQSSLSRWDMLGCFRDMDLATTVATNHSARTRLICVTFEYGKMISQNLVQEMGPVVRPAA